MGAKREKLVREYMIQREVWKRASDDFNPNRASPKVALKEYAKLQRLIKKLDAMAR